MAKLAIVATFEIAPGQIDAFLPLLLAHRDRCLKDEPGTLRFDILRPEKNLMLYEVYDDEAAFQAHWNGPSSARCREEAAGVVSKLTFIRCSLLD
ncbi:MAG TPA: putative quinol monooxygenase [Methylomirabilota bacterium]|nr:putative quinol monooxygenase [Methylomirabilota bacterium]